MSVAQLFLLLTSAVASGPWTLQIGKSNDDFASAVKVDAEDNVLVGGFTWGDLADDWSNQGAKDAFVLKLSGSGGNLWFRFLGGSGYEEVKELQVDADDNVFLSGVTSSAVLDGQSSSGDGTFDVFILKLDGATGASLWPPFLYGEAGGDQRLARKALEVDAAGNVYIAGYTDVSLDGQTYHGGLCDFFVLKLHGNRTFAWTIVHGWTEDDFPTTLKIDSAGNILVAGYTTSNVSAQTNAGSDDVFVVKFDSVGNLLWEKLYGGTSADRAAVVEVDSDGNILLAGSTQSSSFNGQSSTGSSDVFLILLDAGSGNHIWTLLYGTGTSDVAYAMKVVGADVYVTGYTDGDFGGPTAGSADVFIIKTDTAGAHQWTEQLGGPENEKAFAIEVDSAGHVIVAGQTEGDLDASHTNPDGYNDVFIMHQAITTTITVSTSSRSTTSTSSATSRTSSVSSTSISSTSSATSRTSSVSSTSISSTRTATSSTRTLTGTTSSATSLTKSTTAVTTVTFTGLGAALAAEASKEMALLQQAQEKPVRDLFDQLSNAAANETQICQEIEGPQGVFTRNTALIGNFADNATIPIQIEEEISMYIPAAVLKSMRGETNDPVVISASVVPENSTAFDLLREFTEASNEQLLSEPLIISAYDANQSEFRLESDGDTSHMMVSFPAKNKTRDDTNLVCACWDKYNNHWDPTGDPVPLADGQVVCELSPPCILGAVAKIFIVPGNPAERPTGRTTSLAEAPTDEPPAGESQDPLRWLWISLLFVAATSSMFVGAFAFYFVDHKRRSKRQQVTPASDCQDADPALGRPDEAAPSAPQAVNTLRAAATGETGNHIMISGRFNADWKKKYMTSVRDLLLAKGAPVFMVDATYGQDFGEQTIYGLAHADVMVAFCTDDYGEQTGAGYETFEELKSAWDQKIPVIPVQMCENFPPKPRDQAGRDQNKFMLPRCVVRCVDKEANDPERVAQEVYQAWSARYRSALRSAKRPTPPVSQRTLTGAEHKSMIRQPHSVEQNSALIQDQRRFTDSSLNLESVVSVASLGD